MPEPIILLIGLAAAAVLVLAPLFGPHRDDASEDDGSAAVRHRVALEALRDVETDRRAGSLDDAGYAEQLAQAEERAACTRAALDPHASPAPATQPARGRRAAFVVASLIGVVLLAGSFYPATGIGNSTEINQAVADASAAESARQDRIDDLRARLAETPDDPATISSLADAYLAGSTRDDLVSAAVSLQVLIALDPERADAFERIMSAYLRAGDAANARAAHDSYAVLVSADPVEVAFFDGLIALRGENDPAAAVAAFDRFLELAPDEPRADMVRGLRDEAAPGS
ncbi:MAG: c-type cytochrome biogenesis protein CcmI [Candidatus Limnocylindria bacterium]